MAHKNPIPNNLIRTRNKIEQHEHCDLADARRVKVVDKEGNPIEAGNPFHVTATFTGEAKPKVPTIVNFPIVAANTEYNINLPANTVRYALRTRGSSKLQLSYSIGQSNIDFWTIYPDETYEEKGLDQSSNLVLYFQSNRPGDILELKIWTL